MALQNNSPNIQRIGMAEYILPSFSENYNEDINYFINKFRRYLTASENNLANNADKISTLGFFKSCLKSKVGKWLKKEIASKNWKIVQYYFYRKLYFGTIIRRWTSMNCRIFITYDTNWT